MEGIDKKGLSRYERQSALKEIGPEGQERLGHSHVAIVGLGALGSVSADLLVRAGVGMVVLIDRDSLELQNLQRQVLYDESDLAENLPKAVAAKRKLARVNSGVRLEAAVADLDAGTAEDWLGGADLIVDGTDNFETRFLLNDYSLSRKIPWIYGGAVGTEGMSYVILPGEGPCLRCLFPEAPPPSGTQTCDQVGILAPVAHVIASFQAAEAVKLLVGKREEVDRRLWKVDIWKKEFKAVDVAPHPSLSLKGGEGWGEGMKCSGCSRGEYPYLSRDRGSRTVTLCGRNAVQIQRGTAVRIDLPLLAKQLASRGPVVANDYLVRCRMEPLEITVFANGRAIVKGTEDAEKARSFYAKYVGV